MACALLLLAASGASALVYQTLWVKQLSLVVGVDVHAVTVAVSGFFAGLAIGSWAFGRIADSSARPLRLYGLLELGVALAGVGTTLSLAQSARIFARCEEMAGPVAWLLPLVLVGVPATLMGGTLPVLVRALVPTGSISSTGGRLYAANTAGAIAGTLLTAFVLIPKFGVFGSSLVSGTINAFAGIAAFAIGRRSQVPSMVSTSAASCPDRIGLTKRQRLALALYAIAGGIGLGYEVVWSQIIVQWTSTRSFAFAVVLAVYLIGLTIGSALYARSGRRAGDPWVRFGLLIGSAGVIAILQVALLGAWLSTAQVKAATAVFNAIGSEPLAMVARFFVAASCVVLLPTILLGAGFPAALQLMGESSKSGRDSGRILAVNTLGGIVGTLATGFLLVPVFGLERTLALLAVAASLVGATAVLCSPSTRSWQRFAIFGLVFVAVGAAVLLKPDHVARLLAANRKGELLFCETGAGGTVAVIEQRSGSNRFRRLYIQGVSNSGDSMTSLRYMRLQALLPLIIHRAEPRSALVIGLGTGITTGSLLCDETLERRVCAELMPQVVHASRLFQGNFDAASDPRIQVRLRDGRRELLRSDEAYDLITLEPPPPSAAGVVNLYSRDFYELAAARLQPDGLLAQWLPLPTQTEAETRSLIRSFLDVFPHATLWTTELHETLLVGSLSPFELDAARIDARFSQPRISAALREAGIGSSAELLATYVTGREGLERYAANAPAVTDDDPRIEYGPWVLPGEFERMFPGILALQTEPPLVGASDVLKREIVTRREVLHTFYASALSAYYGDRTKWRQSLAWVLGEAPQNSYYRWAAGGSMGR
jgi:spermidine synthase